MSKILNKKVVIPVIIVAVIGLLVLWFNSGSGISDYSEKYKGVNLDEGIKGQEREDTYTNYKKTCTDAKYVTAGAVVNVDVCNYAKSSSGVKVLNNKYDKEKSLLTNEQSYVEYKINVPEAGMYNIELGYFPCEENSRGISIEREFRINGKIPFTGADALDFARVYGDKSTKIKKDNQGNEIRPTQVQKPTWLTSFFRDSSGYEKEPYGFYFEKGENTISLKGVNEPMVISSIKIAAKDKLLTYKEYAEKNKSLMDTKTKDFTMKVQGESAARRSSPSLYATYDRSSGDTEPKNEGKTILNKTGGNQWRVAGDWIEWDVEVPEDGAYVLGIKGRQGYSRGFKANRSVMIDGTVPFAEMDQVSFEYSNTWNMTTAKDADGKDVKVALTKGKHTIRMTVTLGDFGQVLSGLSDSVYNLNLIYRQVMVITGSEPDQYRDYNLGEKLPKVIEAMKLESKRLFRLVDRTVAYTGQKNQQISVALTIANQLETFADDPDEIPLALKNFKENISSLGTSINTLSETALDVDYIALASDSSKLPEVNETSFDKAIHECQLFINSFVGSSSTLGSVYEGGNNTLDVWIIAGRDQSTILKTMIDDTFTPKTNINVNVKLIDIATLLPAVVAGTGPDIALTVQQQEPVNYALRHAALDLTQFKDLDEVLSEYYPSSYEAYKFNGGLYALPETQNFNVLFYRTDICKQLGIEIPKTWDDVINVLPVLQKSSMSIAIPSVERKIGNTTNPDLANYYAQLYQRGGKLYDEDGMKTAIDSEAGINAFEFYTKLFTSYKLEKQYDFVNRFRSGEMPIGIADYSNFNTMAVFAPEIKGLWKFDIVPGYQDEKTGAVNHATQSWGQCSMMLSSTKDKNKAWQFLKWWAKSDTQVRFGRELESVMGASARYATANRVTFDQLSWGSTEANALKKQWTYAFGLPEVAGGYYTPRHITNAIRKVMNNNEDPRETLLDYTKTINTELEHKRDEFGLKTKKTTTSTSTSSEVTSAKSSQD